MPAKLLILGLETATLGGSVCLIQDDSIVGSRMGDPKTSHSNSLLQDINGVLDEARVSLKELDVFSAAVGPGSFTGLRIGLATVKALAVALDKPCVGIGTLAAVAHAAGPSATTIALLPAGRGEVFVQRFSVSQDDVISALDEPRHLSPGRVLERYASVPRAIWAGPGAQVHQDLVRNTAQASDSQWTIAANESNLARHVAQLGRKKFLANHAVKPELLRAIYVRPSDAELNLNVLGK